ncbi:MAG: extracellular solute-binding protein [Spirochaetota bacterium]|nr:MAG: extracellular solute-binding protein [Spirochaetota bacterium]
MKRFKRIAFGLPLLILAFMLFFNGGDEEGAGTAKDVAEKDIFAEPTELIFWWYGESESPGQIKYVERLCADYNKMHPNITVTQVNQGVDVLIPNFMAAYEAQSGPDIVCLWGGIYLLEWVWQGAIVPLNDYIDEEELSHWNGSKFSEYDGKIYGSDLEVHANFSIYWKDHFRDAGLDPNKPPLTWDDLVKYSAKLKAAGHAPYASGFSGGWGGVILADFMWNYLVDYHDIIKAVIGERHFDEPAFIEYWEKVDAYNKAGYFNKNAPSIDWTEGWNEWRAGKATFLSLPGQAALSFVDELGTDKVGYFPYPALSDKKVGWVWPMPHSITSWSKHKELAADFLKYFHAKENYSKMIDIMDARILPADDRFDPGIIQEPEHKKWYAKMAMDWMKQKGHNFLAESALPWAIIEKGLVIGGQALILGEFTPREAADNMEQAAVEWREQNPELLEHYKIWAANY